MSQAFLLTDFFGNIYRYREYLKQSVARDLRKRYKRSVLGYLWSMLHPLFMMVILAVVFSNIMRFEMQDYAVFLFTGMIPWSYFSLTALGALGSIRANASIIDQLPVPKYIFPLSLGFSNLANLFLSLAPLLIIMIGLGRPIPLTVLALPFILLPLFFLTTGLALILAVANVFFDDTQHLATLAIQALYFLSPILYTKEHLPANITPWVTLNPMFNITEFMHDIIYYGRLPELYTYAGSLAYSLLFLVVGLWVFRKTDHKFVYFM